MMKSDSQKSGIKQPVYPLPKHQGLGWISFGSAAFAASIFVSTFSWVLPEIAHPRRHFDYPPGEMNRLWVVPCTLSVICGIASRNTFWGKVGIILSLVVVSGIMLMVHWGLQWLRGW